MSKELEIMKEERERLVQEDYADICIEECDLVIKALQRLEAIDNAEPSEALECLEALEQDIKDRVILAEDRQLKLCAIIKQALLKAQEHNSVNLLMQELDCKDFADLRKYARCGYEKLNKKYLKWEDLEFGKTTHKLKAKMNGNLYRIEWYIDGMGSKVVCLDKYITNDYLIHSACIKDYNQQFFNDLHLERVEE